MEKTPDEYVARLVAVFAEVRRVLRDDGTCWVNLGDSYAGNTTAGNKVFGNPAFNENRPSRALTLTAAKVIPEGLKPKDLIGIPWRVAFALQADGWYLRSDIIWAKPAPMPESVTDRPTKAHEYVFLLAKSERYYYDADAIREPHACGTWWDRPVYSIKGNADRGDKGQPPHSANSEGRNRRSVWTLSSLPTPDAHFATFPIELPEICLRAGAPEGGVVLDPFAGAGTTGLAALKNGRRFIGIELNAEYIEIARRRFDRHMPLLAYAAAADALSI